MTDIISCLECNPVIAGGLLQTKAEVTEALGAGATAISSGSADRLTVTGNACPRGEQYAIHECTNPLRTVTAVLRVANRCDTMVSVKTEQPVPKAGMLEVMARLHRVQVNAPVRIGDVLLEDACGSRIIATKEVL